MIRVGKQIAGPVRWIPDFKLWGGMVWINCYKRSLIISLPQFVIDFCLMVGIDPYGD